MSIVILVYGKKFSHEFLKDLFLVHFYSTYLLRHFLCCRLRISNYADVTARYSVQEIHNLNPHP